MAQPSLPYIAGSAGKGIVILSWVCQYNGIKSITVFRSSDSVNYYSVIGHVKKKDKGVQAFADGHPVAGKNFYKLAIVFNSGLSWSSNHCSVYVDKQSIDLQAKALPENDSLQKFIVTEDVSKPAITDSIASSINRNDKSKVKNNGQAKTKLSIQDTNTLSGAAPKPNTKIDTATKKELVHKVYVSFNLDSTDIVAEISSGNTHSVPPRKKITVTFVDPGENSVGFIKPRFISIDPATGHINMDLPDDVKTHHYSLKFYDEQGHVVIEVPRVNAAKIIIDKRNFQHPGIYKFILRKDVTELERGYIELKPL